jgi:hypothetical protein
MTGLAFLPSPVVVAAASAHGYTTAFWWSAALLALGAVLSWLLIESRGAQALAPDSDATPAQPVMPADRPLRPPIRKRLT